MKILVVYPVIFFFLHTSPAIQLTTETQLSGMQSVYLIKQNWHTALVFSSNQIDTSIIPEAKYFYDYSLIDFGWGDEEFYQYPGFDSGLAFSALFYSTPSTLRVEGLTYSFEDLVKHSEITVKIPISEEQLRKLNIFISETFLRDEHGASFVINEVAGGKIRFYRSPRTYHLFRTCNTWIAEALNQAGFNIESNIILAEQLFNEVQKIGAVIKVAEH